MSLVYQSYFPSGNPGCFDIGHIPVQALSWLPLIFVSFYAIVVVRFLGEKAIIGIFPFELIFSFFMVFISSQLDTYCGSYDILYFLVHKKSKY